MAPQSIEIRDAIRDVREQLKNDIRNDWQSPPIPDGADCDAEPPRIRTYTRTVTVFESRHYGASDNEDLLSTLAGPDAKITGTADARVDSKDLDLDTSIRPSQSALINEARPGYADHVRRRNEAKLEEMSYNRGHLHWQRQRDAWTEAVGSVPEPFNIPDGLSSSATSPNPSTSSPDSSMSSSNTSADDSPAAADMSRLGVYLPVPPPLIDPMNIVRANINSGTYMEIYDKVVRQCRTPSVPINLSDMTKSLVAGWKHYNEWDLQGEQQQQQHPKLKDTMKSIMPRASPVGGAKGYAEGVKEAPNLDGTKRHRRRISSWSGGSSGTNNGATGIFGRLVASSGGNGNKHRRHQSSLDGTRGFPVKSDLEEGAVEAASESPTASRRRSSGYFANHPHMRAGVEGMKKVFRMSGSHMASPTAPQASSPSPSRPEAEGTIENGVAKMALVKGEDEGNMEDAEAGSTVAGAEALQEKGANNA